MSEESLYWALSTLPQVTAALIAFVGFLALEVLSKMDARCGLIEDLIRQTPDHKLKLFLLNLTPSDTRGLGIRTISGGEMMKSIIRAIDEGSLAAEALGHLTADIMIWTPLNEWREKTRLRLKVFVCSNLAITIACLLLLPLSPILASYYLMASISWLVMITWVGFSAGILLYRLFWRWKP
jgi:hypothetical protein